DDLGTVDGGGGAPVGAAHGLGTAAKNGLAHGVGGGPVQVERGAGAADLPVEVGIGVGNGRQAIGAGELGIGLGRVVALVAAVIDFDAVELPQQLRCQVLMVGVGVGQDGNAALIVNVGDDLQAAARGDLSRQEEAQNVAHLGLNLRPDDDEEVRVAVGGDRFHSSGDGVMVADGDAGQPAPPGDTDNVGRRHDPVEGVAGVHVQVEVSHARYPRSPIFSPA